MDENVFQLTKRGKELKVPCRRIEGKLVLVLGKWLRMASIHDEEWLEGQLVIEPEAFVADLKRRGLKADLFTFTQKLPDATPKHPYHIAWDNVAAIRLASFADWWENQLPQESRKNVRRAGRRGVVVRPVELDDQLVRGITAIYNETPYRQGKRFPHYGKSYDTVKREVSTLMDHSEFIGAYFQDELIGFVKLVFMGKIASILHINSMSAHYDKRPTNALLAKAVELCAGRGITHVLYGRYTYGNKTDSPLAEFKRRNGFQEIPIARYYIPLTLWGRIALGLRLYRGLLGLLPGRVVVFLVGMRARYLQHALPAANAKTAPAATAELEEKRTEAMAGSAD
jgi:hypothetical protein